MERLSAQVDLIVEKVTRIEDRLERMSRIQRETTVSFENLDARLYEIHETTTSIREAAEQHLDAGAGTRTLMNELRSSLAEVKGVLLKPE